MVFSIVFSNCHLPSAILLCKKTGQSHDRPANTNTIRHMVCVICAMQYNACLRFPRAFLKTSCFLCKMLKRNGETPRHGSPKCFTIASTSGLRNECRWGW